MICSSLCRLCGGQSTNIQIFTDQRQLTVIGEIMHDFLFPTVEPDEGYPEEICQLCYFQLNVFFEFKKKVMEQHNKLTSLLPVRPTAAEYDSTYVESDAKHVENDEVELEDEEQNAQLVEHNESELEEEAEYNEWAQKFVCEEELSDPTEYPSKSPVIEQEITKSIYSNSPKPVNPAPEEDDSYGMGESLEPEDTVADDMNMLDVPSKIRPFQCKLCGKRFLRRAHCTRHEYRHSNIRPHKCQLCGKRFKTSSDLRVHVEGHIGLKNYECEICNGTFRKHSHLVEHRETHASEITHKCKECEKMLKTSSTLKSHMRTVHTQDYKHKCMVCDRGFHRRIQLEMHKKTHFKVNDKA